MKQNKFDDILFKLNFKIDTFRFESAGIGYGCMQCVILHGGSVVL